MADRHGWLRVVPFDWMYFAGISGIALVALVAAASNGGWGLSAACAVAGAVFAYLAWLKRRVDRGAAP